MKIRRIPFVVVGILLANVLVGCKVKPSLPPLVETVAVLPFDNESNNLDAADIMQRFVYLAMKPSVYRVSDYKAVNAKLKTFGIVDGGQLAALDPVKLGRDLGVQALMFGNVESFGYTNIGIYASRKVSLELKLVDAMTGQTLWEAVGAGATRSFAMNEEDIKKNFAKNLADQLADKIMDMPLQKESKLATMKTLRSLPGFKFHGFEKDGESPSSGKAASHKAIKKFIKEK